MMSGVPERVRNVRRLAVRWPATAVWSLVRVAILPTVALAFWLAATSEKAFSDLFQEQAHANRIPWTIAILLAVLAVSVLVPMGLRKLPRSYRHFVRLPRWLRRRCRRWYRRCQALLGVSCVLATLYVWRVELYNGGVLWLVNGLHSSEALAWWLLLPLLLGLVISLTRSRGLRRDQRRWDWLCQGLLLGFFLVLLMYTFRPWGFGQFSPWVCAALFGVWIYFWVRACWAFLWPLFGFYDRVTTAFLRRDVRAVDYFQLLTRLRSKCVGANFFTDEGRPRYFLAEPLPMGEAGFADALAGLLASRCAQVIGLLESCLRAEAKPTGDGHRGPPSKHGRDALRRWWGRQVQRCVVTLARWYAPRLPDCLTQRDPILASALGNLAAQCRYEADVALYGAGGSRPTPRDKHKARLNFIRWLAYTEARAECHTFSLLGKRALSLAERGQLEQAADWLAEATRRCYLPTLCSETAPGSEPGGPDKKDCFYWLPGAHPQRCGQAGQFLAYEIRCLETLCGLPAGGSATWRPTEFFAYIRDANDAREKLLRLRLASAILQYSALDAVCKGTDPSSIGHVVFANLEQLLERLLRELVFQAGRAASPELCFELGCREKFLDAAYCCWDHNVIINRIDRDRSSWAALPDCVPAGTGPFVYGERRDAWTL